MTSGFRVVCSDGVSRHGELFPTRRLALTWQTFGHVCYLDHHLRREASFSLPPAPVSLESERSDGVGGTNVGTGGVPSRSPTAPGDLHPTPVPTSPAGAS